MDRTIAALFVEAGGVYANLPGVDRRQRQDGDSQRNTDSVQRFADFNCKVSQLKHAGKDIRTMTTAQARKLPDGARVFWDLKNSFQQGDTGRIDHKSDSVLWDDGGELQFLSRRMRYVKKAED